MKKIILGLMALTITFASMAQTTDNKTQEKKELHNGRRHFKDGGNFDKLNLTEDQKAQMKTLNQDFRQQMQDLNKQGSITVDEQRAKRKDLLKEHKAKEEAILTPEQRKQAEELRKDFAGKRGHKGGFDKLTKDLNLTAEQTAKMETLRSGLKTNVESVKQNASLSEQDKKEQLKSLFKKHRNDVEDLLTAEQKEQLKSKRKNRESHNAVK